MKCMLINSRMEKRKNCCTCLGHDRHDFIGNVFVDLNIILLICSFFWGESWNFKFNFVKIQIVYVNSPLHFQKGTMNLRSLCALTAVSSIGTEV